MARSLAPAALIASTIGGVNQSSALTQTLSALPDVALADTLSALPGRVDLWCFFYEEIADSALFDAYFPLITPAERQRHDRFYFERDRRLFLATRALVRTVLSRYVDVSPSAWRFAVGERGKPYIESPRLAAPLHFNLSNTYGLVACAVSTAHLEVGVDVEALDRSGETVNIAEHYFSPIEVQALRALPSVEQRRRFFAYWTLKESYIKARGLGLALPLEQFSFLLDDRAEVGVVFDPRLGDDPTVWRFALLDAPPRHLIAVGVKSGGAPLSLRARRVVPLGDV